MSWPGLRRAAVVAVVEALPPRMFGKVASLVTWPTRDRAADVVFVLYTRMETRADADRTVPWWDASGEMMASALTVVCGVDEAWASHLIGAAVQARVTAGEHLGEDAVLRLAERAACWHKGRVGESVTG